MMWKIAAITITAVLALIMIIALHARLDICIDVIDQVGMCREVIPKVQQGFYLLAGIIIFLSILATLEVISCLM